MRDLNITPKMARVLLVFLEDPTRSRYGFEIMKLAGISSGTLYPILAKLEFAGWLTRGREDIDPRAAGRPRRAHYTITGEAAATARRQLTALSDQYRPPPEHSGTWAQDVSDGKPTVLRGPVIEWQGDS